MPKTTTPRAKRPNGPSILLRLDPELRATLKRHTRTTDVPATVLIRHLLRAHFGLDLFDPLARADLPRLITTPTPPAPRGTPRTVAPAVTPAPIEAAPDDIAIPLIVYPEDR